MASAASLLDDRSLPYWASRYLPYSRTVFAAALGAGAQTDSASVDRREVLLGYELYGVSLVGKHELARFDQESHPRQVRDSLLEELQALPRRQASPQEHAERKSDVQGLVDWMLRVSDVHSNPDEMRRR